MSTLFSPWQLGPLSLPTRVVMAPMTRSRAVGNLPNALVATYYAQRAEAALLITEGTAPSPDGLGYARIPGLYTGEQARAWRVVTDAVHDRGGRIFVQLMHTGRVAHPLNMAAGARILAPSAIAAPGMMWTDQEQMQPHPVPVEMSAADIEAAVASFEESAALAVGAAGFDGVELHGGNGYLIDQFLETPSNRRTDRWGGSPENRARFAVEVARRVGARIGAERVGMRLSPFGALLGMAPDPETVATYELLASKLGGIGLAYLHVIADNGASGPAVPDAVKDVIRARFANTLILAGQYDRARAEADLDAGRADLVAFGRPFIANPNLVTKLRSGSALAGLDPTTLFTAGPEGYIDYPEAA